MYDSFNSREVLDRTGAIWKALICFLHFPFASQILHDVITLKGKNEKNHKGKIKSQNISKFSIEIVLLFFMTSCGFS